MSIEKRCTSINSFDPNDLARLQTMLPDQVNNIGLILDLDTLANQYGLSLENVGIASSGANSSGQGAQAPTGDTTSIGTSATPYDSLGVTFTVHCTYSQFIAYVSSLETSLRIVDLVGLSVTSGGATTNTSASSLHFATTTPAGADTNIYTFNITLRTYWLK